MKRRLKRIFMIFVLVVMLVSSFFAGSLATQAGWLPGGATPALAADTRVELTVFWEAWDLIERRFIDRDRLDGTRLSYAAIGAIIEELGDTGHTRFLTPDQARQHETSMDGRFFGIGARLGLDDDGHPIIVQPFFGSPAEEAGLQPGDRLFRVNGENVTELTVDQIVDRIRGAEGTIVTLTVLRAEEVKPKTVAITRAEIVIPALSWTFIPDSRIALIRLSQFSAQANAEMAQALAEVQANEAAGLIIDVRGNPGGLLKQAIGVSSQFLTEG